MSVQHGSLKGDSISDVPMQELKLETAELLPSRETLHCWQAKAPAAQREGSAQRAGRPPALRGRSPSSDPGGYVREEQADDPGSRAPGHRRQPNQPASGPGARVFRTPGWLTGSNCSAPSSGRCGPLRARSPAGEGRPADAGQPSAGWWPGRSAAVFLRSDSTRARTCWRSSGLSSSMLAISRSRSGSPTASAPPSSSS